MLGLVRTLEISFIKNVFRNWWNYIVIIFENFSPGHLKIPVVYWVKNRSSLNDEVLLLKSMRNHLLCKWFILLFIERIWNIQIQKSGQ